MTKQIFENKETLTLKNIQPNAIIENKSFPDWGQFIVENHYASHTWNIKRKNGRDGRILDEGEFKYWFLIK